MDDRSTQQQPAASRTAEEPIARRAILRALSGAGMGVGAVAAGMLVTPETAHAASASMPGQLKLQSGPSASATTVTLTGSQNLSAAGWLLIDPFTVQCEIRKISSLAANGGNTDVTITTGLTYTHAANDIVLWTEDPTTVPSQ